MMPEVGEEGQQKLREARVFIMGSGGLASSSALYLAAAGIGKIGIADNDRVDLSNLNRQVLHNTARIGMAKVASAKQTLQALHPGLDVETYEQRISSSDELETVIADYDLVVDCTDNYATRFNINTACLQSRKPWVYGAVSGFDGQVMTILPNQGPCYQCLYPSAPLDSDDPIPVMGVTPGIIGLLEATEAIKCLLGIGIPLVGRMLYIDLLDMGLSEFKIKKNPKCPACGPTGS